MNKMLFRYLVIALIIISSASAAYATNGAKVIGVGPVQRSMGGASVGLPLDSGITVSNPAGMSYLERRADIGLSVAVPTSSHTATSAAALVTHNGETQDSDTPQFVLGAFGTVVPITEDLTVGIGIYHVAGLGVDYEKNLYLNVTYVEFTALKIAPAISYSFGDFFSVGVSPYVGQATYGYEVGVTTQKAHNDDTAYGFGYTVGLLFKPLGLMKTELPEDLLSIGVAYESKFDFEDFEYNTVSGKDELEFDLPQSLALGIGLEPTERIRVAFDVVWIDWPEVLGPGEPAYNVNNSSASILNADWDEQLVYKIGVEFDAMEKLTLRAGYNYGEMPQNPNRAFENLALGVILEHHITGGLGIHFTENIDANVGFVYAPEASLDTSNAGQFLNTGNAKMSMYSIDMGLAYKF